MWRWLMTKLGRVQMSRCPHCNHRYPTPPPWNDLPYTPIAWRAPVQDPKPEVFTEGWPPRG